MTEQNRLTRMAWYDDRLSMAEAIQMAWDAFEWVPPGWRWIFTKAIRSFLACRTRDREVSLLTLSADIDRGLLELDTLAQDRVLKGIIRKCRLRSGTTCIVCGRKGKPRYATASDVEVLCPACAAPRLLVRSIREARDFRSVVTAGGSDVVAGFVPEVLRPRFMRAATRGSGEGAPLRMTATQYRAWVEELHELSSRLPVVT